MKKSEIQLQKKKLLHVVPIYVLYKICLVILSSPYMVIHF